MLPDEIPGDTTIGNRDLTQWRTGAGRTTLSAFARLADRVAQRVGVAPQTAALWLTAVIGGVAAVAATWVAAEVYEAVADHDGVAAFDRPVLDWMVAHRTSLLNADVTAFTNLGGSVDLPIVLVAVLSVMVIAWRSRTPVVLMALALAGSLAMTTVGKLVVGRSRPLHTMAVAPYENSPSFPSGHTLNMTVVVGILLYLLLPQIRTRTGRWLAVAFGALMSIGIGLSRVYLGHHWLTDVMAGWALGLGWVVAVVTAHRVYLTLRDDPNGHVGAGRPGSSD